MFCFSLHSVRTAHFTLATLSLLALTACKGGDSAPRANGATTSGTSGDATLAPAAKTALDAGNAAYRAKQYPEALAQYRAATVAAPGHAAPWFGLYMIANTLKDSALADSAMRHVKSLSADPAALGAHDEVATATEKALGGSMPAAHPSVGAAGAASPHGAAPNFDATQPLPPGHPMAPGAASPALPPGHPSPGKLPTGPADSRLPMIKRGA